MELKRRQFLLWLAAGLALLPAALRATAPVRWMRAQITVRYPGPVAALDTAAMKKPAKWLG